MSDEPRPKRSTEVLLAPTEAALLALYEKTWEEIAQLREYQWRIAYGLLTLSAALIAAVNVPAIRGFLTPTLRWILSGAQGIAAILAVYYLIQVHVFLTLAEECAAADRGAARTL